MNKVIRDGKVAVLISEDYGAGWYSWNTEHEALLFDPAIVEFLEQNKWDELSMYVKLKYPDVYDGGLNNLQIKWLPIGTKFIVIENDGAESLLLMNNTNWITA
jgi:hypothetical protein